MQEVTIVTFRGCQSALDFKDYLDEVQVSTEMVFASGPEQSAELGLHGSPTILIDSQEYQSDLAGPAGFY